MSGHQPLARVTAILQARTASSRLPGKVLVDLEGAPMLWRQIERIRRAKLIDQLTVATSDDPSDDDLAVMLRQRDVAVYRGSLDDVLSRFAGAAAQQPSQHVVRLTGDCPLADPDVIDATIAHHLVSGGDITANAVEPTFPDGLDVEVLRSPILIDAANEAAAKFEREHVTQFFYRRPERFRVIHYKQSRDLSGLRWTVDEPSDLAFVRRVYARLYRSQPDFGMQDVLDLIAREPEIAAMNTQFERNEGLARSISAEQAETDKGKR